MQPAAKAILAALLVTLAGCTHAGTQNDRLTVSVAASLQNSMAELSPGFAHSQPGVKLVFNFGASGTLEQQIERGAPVDVFFPAAPKPMDALASKGLILADTRRDLLRNQVVLIAPKDRPGPSSFEELNNQNVKLIALGDPDSVPAGNYGRQVLQNAGLWAAVQSKLVLSKDVRQVLTYVETGNADAGIVYATDAQESDKIRVVETAAAGTHAPVVYPIAVVKDSHHVAAARALIAFLAGGDAMRVFSRHGFTAVSP
jgi:molybdate transport system substrate-binding protein